MIRTELTSIDGKRSGTIRWDLGTVPVLTVGTLLEVEADETLAVFTRQHMQIVLDGGGYDKGEETSISLTESSAAFLWGLALLPGEAGVMVSYSTLEDTDASAG